MAAWKAVGLPPGQMGMLHVAGPNVFPGYLGHEGPPPFEEVDGKKRALVKMTLTAPGCGMGPTIAADAQSRIMTIEDMDDAAVELVWEPPWNQGMISVEGKMKLGMI